ncbi:hypothetical protein LINGRAHAP2_LOCUS27338 [Linum grandiflorum]
MAQFDLPIDPIPILDFKNCVVGSLLTTRPYNFQKLKHRMAVVWEPSMGMKAEELGRICCCSASSLNSISVGLSTMVSGILNDTCWSCTN